MYKYLRCCLNWRVIVGLGAAVTVLALVTGPASAGAALPVMIALVCPLSMGLMIWGMARGRPHERPSPAGDQTRQVDELERELARLRALRRGVDPG